MMKSFYVHIDVLQFISRDRFHAKSNVLTLNATKFVLVLVQVELIRTISHYNQKTDTTAQLYCTLSTYMSM